MKNRIKITLLALVAVITALAQSNVFTPYSRYGIGELNQTTYAHNTAMGGAYVAWRPDSTPNSYIFINGGNPAAYPLIRLASLEVGGQFNYSMLTGSSSSVKKWGTNFAYGTLGFPVRRNGGASLGIMPFSNVGYDVQSTTTDANIGNVNYQFNGTGGLNKAFVGYGVMPFDKALYKFRVKHLNIPDSMRKLTHAQYMRREAWRKIASDLSFGFNVNYIFGNIEQTARVIYPNSILYNNTYRIRNFTMGDFTGNFGMQGAYTIDSVSNKKGRKKAIEQTLAELQKSGSFSETDLNRKRDSLEVVTPRHKRSLREKVKFTYGFFMALNNPMKVTYDAAVYNYILNGSGQEVIRDTVFHTINEKSTISLPLEQGFGVGFKKGERLNIVADFALTNWTNFKYLGSTSSFKDNYRIALGVNYIPEKGAAGNGALFRKMNYRFGVNYNTGFIEYKNTTINSYAVTAGVGIPVGIGRQASMVNLSVQYGQSGSTNNNLVRENFVRINFGFTFSDRWFQKFKYD